MKVILLEDDPALAMLTAELKAAMKEACLEVLEEYKATHKPEPQGEEANWVDGNKAREILGVKKTKMQCLRDNSPMNGIVFSQHGRTLRYYKPSLFKYLEKHKVG